MEENKVCEVCDYPSIVNGVCTNDECETTK